MRYPYHASEERARREKSRFVWLSRAPFLIAALCGGATLVAMKLLGLDQLYITISACAIIIAYWAIVAAVPVLRIREDQLGDNCYYLGFLFTLASLAYALYQFGGTGDVDQIVANFGLALGSTITGILLRVLINQARRDVLETETDARMALAEAVVRLRTNIDDAVLALGSFCRSVQQVTAEQIGVAAKETNAVLEQSVVRVGDTSQAAMQQIDQAFSEFHEHASRINATTAQTAVAMGHMLAAIDSATGAIRELDDSLRATVERDRHR
jgi:methyl-accepting chemotaxis protein